MRKCFKVLVVEDDSAAQNMIEDHLLCSGHRVVPIGSAEIALDYFERGEWFDVVIIDVDSLGTAGFELLDAVKRHEEWKQLPVIIWTTRSITEIVQHLVVHPRVFYADKRKGMEMEDIERSLKRIWKICAT